MPPRNLEQARPRPQELSGLHGWPPELLYEKRYRRPDPPELLVNLREDSTEVITDTLLEDLVGLYRDGKRRAATRYTVMKAGILERIGLEADDHERTPYLTLQLPGENITFKFAITSNLMYRLGARLNTQVPRDPLPLAELLDIGFEETQDAVESEFTPGAPNAINALYYASEIAFAPQARLANLYVANRPLNSALGQLLSDNTESSTVRIKELCSGTRLNQWGDRAHSILEKAGHLHVTVSDFVAPPSATHPSIEGVSFNSQQYSLLDDMPPLHEHERYDAIIATFGFDSVWQPEDIHLVQSGGSWYQSLYRVKVASWHPRREELVTALRTQQPLPNALVGDYDGIAVERILQPFDVWQHPFGNYLATHERTNFSFPGGLIKRVVQSFESQLRPGGTFISCDSGYFGQELPYNRDVGITGICARYRMDDYVIAKRVLEQEYGLQVTLLNIAEFAQQYLSPEWIEQATEAEICGLLENRTGGIMIVSIVAN